MRHSKKNLSNRDAPLRRMGCNERTPAYMLAQQEVDAMHNIAAIGRALWKRLFLEVFTEEDLVKWEADIPNYDCKCKDFYTSWKLENPVIFPIDMDWKYRLKSAVNEKLGKPNISFEEAVRVWSV